MPATTAQPLYGGLPKNSPPTGAPMRAAASSAFRVIAAAASAHEQAPPRGNVV